MVDRLKAEQSISHYRTRLEMGAEPETRAVLLRQLLAEEKDLGRTREQLARIDRDIEKLRRTIAEHQKHIKRFKLIGTDTERATLTLSTLNDLMALYERHRRWLTVEVADGEAD